MAKIDALPDPPIETDPAHEPHFKPKQVAAKWGISESTATHLFENEPGVIKMGNRNSRRRTRISLRIPLSVMERVHRKLSA